jgi:hypothetical protein
MDIKINYGDPNSISTYSSDQLIIKFPKLKNGDSVLKLWVPYEVTVAVPKQMASEVPEGECD